MTTPKRITVTRSFTYDIEDIRLSFYETNGETLTDEEILQFIIDESYEDHLSPISRHDLVIVDSDTGEEL
jgi:hypothetical protein